MKIAVLIVAAGQGLRVGGDTPKQYRNLAGKPVLARTINCFTGIEGITTICCVIGGDHHGKYTSAITGISNAHLTVPVTGGASRQESVRLGLEALPTDTDIVLVHDAARPFVSQHLIRLVISHLKDHSAVLPVLPVVDTVRRGSAGFGGDLVDRTNLFRAQTPQGFHYREIMQAHQDYINTDATDDAELARLAGVKVKLLQGEEQNIKLTTEIDFKNMEQKMQPTVRFGHGYDVHAFGPGDHVWLCGVKIPHDKALVGHSDADVGLHALTDAIFGAAAMGDIGQHFPPSDPQWKGAESHIFLSHAAKLVREQGMDIGNVDVTLICERPKVGPHAEVMRKKIAEILSVDMNAVNVKATTSERLGFTGREEGIASMATATLIKG